ncbi:hypothetical protein [Streptacidiphilus albus]|uniref:hypothetical protein n=1 Tax=Streptacidiphilus albus TaxID=105425 RepID=UPI0005A6AAF1|nr:hypothetical protein [Streptacidiphilus albus]
MVPTDFQGYFAATAAGAAALIGLLFVAVSLRPESLLGSDASARGRAVAGSAFTALVNSFFVSIIALIPLTSLGYTAVVMAVLSLYATYQTHREPDRLQAGVTQLVAALAAYLCQLAVGCALVARPSDAGLVTAIAYLLIASFAVALKRAWILMGREEVAIPGTRTTPEAASEGPTGSYR